MTKRKTIAMITENREGFWIGDLSHTTDETSIWAKPGAWVARMEYEQTGAGEEWIPTVITVKHSSALLQYPDKWERVKELQADDGHVVFRGIGKVKQHRKTGEALEEWKAGIRKVLAGRDFTELSNYFAFQVKPGKLITVDAAKNPYGDVVNLRIAMW